MVRDHDKIISVRVNSTALDNFKKYDISISHAVNVVLNLLDGDSSELAKYINSYYTRHTKKFLIDLKNVIHTAVCNTHQACNTSKEEYIDEA